MDNKELEKIYNDTYRSVYWTAMSLLRDEDEAQDIVQETFVTLIDSYDTLRDKDKVAAWLKKIAANKCLNILTRTRTFNADDEFFDDTGNTCKRFAETARNFDSDRGGLPRSRFERRRTPQKRRPL